MAEFNPSKYKSWTDQRRRSRSGSQDDRPMASNSDAANAAIGRASRSSRSMDERPVMAVKPRSSRSSDERPTNGRKSRSLDVAPSASNASPDPRASASLLARLYAACDPPGSVPSAVLRALTELDDGWGISVLDLVSMYGACGGALDRLPADEAAWLAGAENGARVASGITTQPPLVKACAAAGLALGPSGAPPGGIMSGLGLGSLLGAAPPEPAGSSQLGLAPVLAGVTFEEFVQKVLEGSRMPPVEE